MPTPYQKQTVTEPAFPERIWSQPEQAARRGKLTIIGGTANGVSSIMNAYADSQNARIGQLQVVLPDSLKSVTGQILEHGTYAPRNPSGGLSKQALATALDSAAWADGVLFPGDLGKNSETIILLERFVEEYPSWITYANDAAENIISHHEVLKEHGKITLVLSTSQLQLLVKTMRLTQPVTHDMGLSQLVPLLQDISQTSRLNLIVPTPQGVVAVSEGRTAFTECPEQQQSSATTLASFVSVWLVQQPEPVFESITSAVWLTLQTTQAKSA